MSKKLAGRWQFIDLFWPGVLIVEHTKNCGKPLGAHEAQASQYIHALKQAERDGDIPRYIIVTDFARIAIHDLQDDMHDIFDLRDVHRHAGKFGFIAGHQRQESTPDDPLYLAGVELLGELHDALQTAECTRHDLERLLIRVLFSLFAERTGLFPSQAFTRCIQDETSHESASDGAGFASRLERLFATLNQEPSQRQRKQRRQNPVDALADLPRVPGHLFAEKIVLTNFGQPIRDRLLACCGFDWSRISPAVFGSLFESVLLGPERRRAGAHYTSERDIMKVVRSLLLDDLRAEFQRSRNDTASLEKFHNKLASLRFLDPACGCGNFLVVTYRELRLLEIEVLMLLRPAAQGAIGARCSPGIARQSIGKLSIVGLDAMHGIEIDDFAAQIAELALWLTDHQMNQRLDEAFGQHRNRSPRAKSATIRHANALRIDWRDVISPGQCSYVLGNPPFVGKQLMTDEQADDMRQVWGERRGIGVLDYVTAWYRKAAEYIQGTKIRVAFVSTNSISQGEQVAALWTPLFQELGVQIDFAHATFPWESEVRGKAQVHVVIIGFSKAESVGRTGNSVSRASTGVSRTPTGLSQTPSGVSRRPTGVSQTPNGVSRTLVEYSSRRNAEGMIELHAASIEVHSISPYLCAGGQTLLFARAKPLCDVPAAIYGSKPTDHGFLIVEERDRAELCRQSPLAARFLRPLVCADEFINNVPRWCLWLADADPCDWRRDPILCGRVSAVKQFRLASKKARTNEAASTPALFAEIRQPSSAFIVIPQHSSERRRYIPFGFFSPEHIVHNSCTAIPRATHCHFGVLSSAMHMAWARTVCGRIKSDYRYSTTIAYNNFPWPEASDQQMATVAAQARAVLEERAAHAGASLANLYDPLTMPPSLLKAHAALDEAVDACYRSQPFETDRERIELLFALYEKLTGADKAGSQQRHALRRRRAPTSKSRTPKALATRPTAANPSSSTTVEGSGTELTVTENG